MKLPAVSRLAIVATLLCNGLISANADELFPKELTKFAPTAANPVFTAQGEGHWDVKIRERGWIMFDQNAAAGSPAWRMWYTGYDGTRDGQKKLGLATSNDGVKWTPHPDNPIYGDAWVEDMMIVPHDGTLYMFAEGQDDQAHLLKSTDGVAWQRVGPLDVRKANGKPIEPGPYGTPTAYYEDDLWYLFYERRDAGIWLATSRDMKVWTNVSDEPVMVPGPDEFDLDLIAMNQVFKYRGRYYASIHGSKAGSKLWANGIAVSDDLRNWKKYPGNPLRPISENKSSGLFIHDGKQFRFYTMHGEVHVHSAVPR
ncbi:MAG: glycosylase [Planctomycetota bacterium]|nr:glycosylase [Planctomycetota bacterium]MDA0918074.1 glycosylase [Planctomycetota bacterium]MDA1160869.1 glycosylase [Planctomycetota bacterium]